MDQSIARLGGDHLRSGFKVRYRPGHGPTVGFGRPVITFLARRIDGGCVDRTGPTVSPAVLSRRPLATQRTER